VTQKHQCRVVPDGSGYGVVCAACGRLAGWWGFKGPAARNGFEHMRGLGFALLAAKVLGR
jgi:hypothetical protein